MIKKYGMTSYLLCSLAKCGFQIDILKYGMNVIMDAIGLSTELLTRGMPDAGDAPVIDMSADTDFIEA